jgi:hypothetical protein
MLMTTAVPEQYPDGDGLQGAANSARKPVSTPVLLQGDGKKGLTAFSFSGCSDFR